ncbi:MAG: hypothetical protein UHP27_04165 [Muribaculaceae bacterium]|nr:hypothetical protein [Muribaculaceae bacterium]
MTTKPDNKNLGPGHASYADGPNHVFDDGEDDEFFYDADNSAGRSSYLSKAKAASKAVASKTPGGGFKALMALALVAIAVAAAFTLFID